MSDECTGVCVEPLRFPAPVENRPGLPRIAYRIGTYGSIRQALLRKLDLAAPLGAWTHRAADDPGIALLEGVAVVGDILTLYHEAYANEAYLRTALWRESVADLVRLTGYRLSPALAGRAAFAFEVRAGAPVTVPAGFPISAQVEGVEGTVDWETEEALTAYPALGRFNLYRPFSVPQIGPATPELRIVGPDPDVPAVPLIAGDRLVIGNPSPASGPNQLTGAEIVVIDSVRTLHGRPVYRLRGALTRTPTAGPIVAYKLGRSFRHFGYNAPPVITVVDGKTVSQQPVGYTRPFVMDAEDDVDPPIESNELPLDAEVDDLAAGGAVVVQTGGGATLVRTIRSVRQGAYTWGAMTGGSTVLRLNANLDAGASVPLSAMSGGVSGYIASTGGMGAELAVAGHASAVSIVFYMYLDIRDIAVHETLGPLLTLEALEQPTAATEGKELFFLGTAEEAGALADRRLLLEGLKDEAVETGVALVAPPAAGQNARRILRSINLESTVDYAFFPHEGGAVTVYGNVVQATQGKSQRETVLGNGDAREAFQTFALPRAPLTYLVSEGAAPPEVPELQVYVAGRLWTRVPTFFNRGATEEVYVVREDADGKSWVQFGDGITGARLPSGVANVSAAYRTGSGAFGALREGTTVSAGARLDRLEKVRLPGVASGGTEAESAENARAAAPGKVQSLDRLVSLADFEAEALAIAGVWRATAAWEMSGGVPSLLLTVLMESGREGEMQVVRDTLAAYDRCRGMQRFPVVVVEGDLLPVFVHASFAFDPTCREADVRLSIEAALGVSGGAADPSAGLFWPGLRRFGAREYATRVEGAIQNAAGVLWAKVTAIGAVGSPASTTGQVLCPGDRVLALDVSGLQLSAVVTPGAECA